MKTARALFASLLLAASCLYATTNGQRTCTQLDKTAFIFAYPDRIELAESPDECRDMCASDSTCAVYSITFEGSFSCFMYSTIDFPNAGTTVPQRWVVGRCGSVLPQVNGDIPGHDLKNVKASDAVQCSYLCEQTTGCNAYSWTNYNGGTCWMKTELTPNFVGATDGSVISGEVFRCRIQGPDNDFRGQDMGSVKRADWRDCCGVCRRTKGCVVSAWSNYNGGTCWLKKTRSNAFSSEGVRSMFLT